FSIQNSPSPIVGPLVQLDLLATKPTTPAPTRTRPPASSPPSSRPFIFFRLPVSSHHHCESGFTFCSSSTATAPRALRALACRNLPSFPRRSTLPNRMELEARRRRWSSREAPQEWRSASSPDAPRAAPTRIRFIRWLVVRHLLVEESLKHLLRTPPVAALHLPLQLHLPQDCTSSIQLSKFLF
ncbi:unnamed protein product, partial [Urochloa humidicola]